MRISEMMDYIFDDSLEIEDKSIVSSERIKELTMKKIESGKSRKKNIKIPLKISVAVAAICLTGAIGVAAATVLKVDFYEGLLGNKTKPNVEAHTEYQVDEDKGLVPYQMPAREYVELDINEAEEMLGDYVMDTPLKKEIMGNTITIITAVRDEDCMLMEYTIENENGVDALYYDEKTNMAKGARWSEKSFAINCKDSGDFIYVDLEKSTDNKLYCYDYIVFEEEVEDGNNVEFCILDYTKNKDEVKTVEIIDVPVNKCIPRVKYTSNQGGEMYVSAIGSTLNLKKGLNLRLVEPGEIRDVIIKYDDGTEYVVWDENTLNTGYELGEGEEFRFTFNRLVNIEKIITITVNGIEYYCK
ncbi:MAG: hypothetical protein K6G88_01990 [Lachnospiraceae bacterium]|nr:hypothetical protein [Lachnospiraceae bacterium]